MDRSRTGQRYGGIIVGEFEAASASFRIRSRGVKIEGKKEWITRSPPPWPEISRLISRVGRISRDTRGRSPATRFTSREKKKRKRELTIGMSEKRRNKSERSLGHRGKSVFIGRYRFHRLHLRQKTFVARNKSIFPNTNFYSLSLLFVIHYRNIFGNVRHRILVTFMLHELWTII